MYNSFSKDSYTLSSIIHSVVFSFLLFFYPIIFLAQTRGFPSSLDITSTPFQNFSFFLFEILLIAKMRESLFSVLVNPHPQPSCPPPPKKEKEAFFFFSVNGGFPSFSQSRREHCRGMCPLPKRVIIEFCSNLIFRFVENVLTGKRKSKEL